MTGPRGTTAPRRTRAAAVAAAPTKRHSNKHSPEQGQTGFSAVPCPHHTPPEYSETSWKTTPREVHLFLSKVCSAQVAKEVGSRGSLLVTAAVLGAWEPV